MTAAAELRPRRVRPVRIWLTLVAMLIAVMVLVGGATRLTESGLSIVEWKPVTGTLPPLNDAQWRDAFEGYKTIPQYRELNAGMTLGEFKTIFWWEWGHRLLGRVIGIAYLLPLLWFLWRGAIDPEWKRALWAIFALGALQGAVGWWMVASGLSQRTEVSQVRLAIHLTLALVIYAAIVWTLRRLAGNPPIVAAARLKFTAIALLALTLVQLFLGALVAGLRAGRMFNTWPLIDGAMIPEASRLWFEQPWWKNLFDNHLTVQFDHRMMAYALWALAAWHAIDALRARAGGAAGGALWLFAALSLQAVLGILTLLYQVPIGLALAHQAVGIVVLTLAVLQVERLTASKSNEAPRVMPTPAGQRG
ncbi:COX15/CtaA family protein [Rhodopseudomonas pseudopalustris]|uniref:Heme A synthase n=1 Tax=Rhodopseudomonas pseudopalustris TaxID=1513892 RepID=A0A1H8T084_9BRAD|nr:COX15/CtaA family protein [Rhodopseudomonas pseudopalustris]SEO84317.1 cytochrome c oxidase assembly protein subunit 15 [Rhodopseudomonas pseudopalustris]